MLTDFTLVKRRQFKATIKKLIEKCCNKCWTFKNRTKKTFDIEKTALIKLNPFLTNISILYPLKIPEKLWFSGVFRVYNMGTMAKNGLIEKHKHYTWAITDDNNNKPEFPFYIILSVDEYLKNQDQHNDQNWESRWANYRENLSWMDNHLSWQWSWNHQNDVKKKHDKWQWPAGMQSQWILRNCVIMETRKTTSQQKKKLIEIK